MEEIAEVSRHYTRRFLEILVAGKLWNVPLEFKFSPGLTMTDLEASMRDFESYHSKIAMPPKEAMNNVQVFNFDDTSWSSGPCYPASAHSHNATIYVSAGGRQWAQDFFLWSSLGGRSQQMLRLIFKVQADDVVPYFDGIYSR